MAQDDKSQSDHQPNPQADHDKSQPSHDVAAVDHARAEPDNENAQSNADARFEDDKTESTTSSSTKPYKGIVLAGGVALVALGISLGVAWLGHQRAEQLSQQVEQLSQLLGDKVDQTALTQQTQLSQSLKAAQQTLKNQQETQATQLERLTRAVAQNQAPKPADWQLAEAEYLLRLAHQRLVLEADKRGAMTLLENADQRLRQMDLPTVLSIRAALKQDIQTLAASELPDRVDLNLQLAALRTQARTLPITPLQTHQHQDANKVETPAESHWYQSLAHELGQLVVIRQRQNPVQPLLTPQQEALLRQSLTLKLQGAGWAALRGEQSLYQGQLKEAQNLLTQFDTESQAVKAFRTELTQLLNTPVAGQLPDVSRGLTALQAFLSDRYGVPRPVTPTQEQPEQPHDAEGGQP